jgi:hypothetical protein
MAHASEHSRETEETHPVARKVAKTAAKVEKAAADVAAEPVKQAHALRDAITASPGRTIGVGLLAGLVLGWITTRSKREEARQVLFVPPPDASDHTLAEQLKVHFGDEIAVLKAAAITAALGFAKSAIQDSLPAVFRRKQEPVAVRNGHYPAAEAIR